jgi:hypothetical protein
MIANQAKEPTLDDIETMIIMSLYADNLTSHHQNRIFDKNGGVYELNDQGCFLGFDKMIPESSFTFDMSPDRIYSTSKEYLVGHQSEILGDTAEVTMLSNGILKWRGFRKMSKPPKGVCSIGKVSHWYEMHQRFTSMKGDTQYYKRAVPISKSGKILPAFVNGHIVCGPLMEGAVLNVCCSLIEDAQRTGIMLASVKEEREIKFPIPIADYKEVFLDRNGPFLGSGKKKAIIHWVSSHLRKRKNDDHVLVSKHIRGVQSFLIDGISIVISPSKYDMQSLENKS